MAWITSITFDQIALGILIVAVIREATDFVLSGGRFIDTGEH